MTDRHPLAESWDVGERPKVPMAYIKLPKYAHVQAKVRNSSTLVSQKPSHLEEARERHAVQRRPGQGWRSKLHRALDYRTVDELGLTPDQLVLDPKPPEEPAKLTIVQATRRRKGGADSSSQYSFELEPGKRVADEVLEQSYVYYKIMVRQRNVSLKIELTAIVGDPDMYVCNRYANPQQTQHSWRSAGVGDDTVLIRPDDPLFYPGYFFIGIFGAKEARFTILVRGLPRALGWRGVGGVGWGGGAGGAGAG